MNNIFIAAHPRSGSTYLCKLMDQIRELEVYFEIFHFDQAVIEQHLKGQYTEIAQQLNLPDDKELARSEIICRNDEYIDALCRLNDQRQLAFKVFPGHLPPPQLEKVIGNSHLVVLLRRNLLHSYLSNIIAKNIQKWGTVDTSNEKCKFSSSDFISHISRILAYYKMVEDYVKKYDRPMVYIDYESIASANAPLSYLYSTLSGYLQLTSRSSCDDLTITRQDKRTNATDKVINPDELITSIKLLGLSNLDNGQFSCEDTFYEIALNKYRLLKNGEVK